MIKRNLAGFKHRDLFNCSINAGCTALPALLNIKQVMQQRQVTGIWSGKDELPVSNKDAYLYTYLNKCRDIGIQNIIEFLSSADRDRSGKAEPLSFSLRLSYTQATKYREQSADETGLRPRHFPRRAE